MASPYLESMTGKQVLILTEDIDEFLVNYIATFKDHRLVSITSETDVERASATPTETAITPEEKSSVEQAAKKALGEKASQIKFTDKLTTSPAVVTSQISPHMRKMMKNMMLG
jgi:TNF receptor-associated protein 1